MQTLFCFAVKAGEKLPDPVSSRAARWDKMNKKGIANMKKFAAIVLALCLVFALAVPAYAADAKTLKVWVPDATKEFTEQQIAVFMEAHPEYADYADVD